MGAGINGGLMALTSSLKCVRRPLKGVEEYQKYAYMSLLHLANTENMILS